MVILKLSGIINLTKARMSKRKFYMRYSSLTKYSNLFQCQKISLKNSRKNYTLKIFLHPYFNIEKKSPISNAF